MNGFRGRAAIGLLLAVALAAPAAAQRPQYRMQIEPGAVEVPRGSLLIRGIDSVWTATGEILSAGFGTGGTR